jgi:serine/threonine protein kinase
MAGMSAEIDTLNTPDTRPELFAQFNVLQELGDGAAAVVFLVTKKGEEKQYALKLLTNDKAFDDNTIERFREELRICQGIRHPNIVEAYELLTLDGDFAYLMEYIEGADLSDLFKQSKFHPNQIDSIFRQLLPAVIELHVHGVLHRDIKLENVLLRTDGTIKLSDLGLMKQYSKDLTATGVILGTAHYLPPEYVREGIYDVRSEVYVLGTMLFEMVSGTRWLAHLKGAQALEHLIKSGFKFPLDALVDAQPKHRYILQKALSSNPTDRFQSVKEMLAAFDMAEVPPQAKLSSDSVVAEPVKPRDELYYQPGPSKKLLIALLLSTVALFAGITIVIISLIK